MPGRHRIFVFLAALVLLLASSCSKKSDDADQAAPKKKGGPTTTTAPPPLAWTFEGVEANGTQAPAEDVVNAVKQTLTSYLNDAVVGPLRAGTPAGDLSGIFSADAIARITNDPSARATLLDEGMPPASKTVTADAANASMSSVASPDGAVALVAVNVRLKLHAAGPALDVDITREGQFVLSPEPAGWRIDSFLLRTARDSRDAVTPTTTTTVKP